MKVLVLGASGFIGFPACQALVRAGHIVYGQTRSEEKIKQFRAEEIIPIIGEMSNPASWLSVVSTIDVVIDTSRAVPGEPPEALSFHQAVREFAQNHRPKSAPRVTYILTTGTWLHGDNRQEVVSDTTPITNPMKIADWRPAVEQKILHDDVLNGMVIRPSLLYGRSGSLLTPFFESASEGNVLWYGTSGARLSVVHCDDLADLYVKAAEKGQLLGGVIFDASNPLTESTDDFLQKLVKVSGAKKSYKYLKPENQFQEALSATALVRPYLARALLGWEPRKPGLVDGLDIYYSACLANASAK